MTLKERVLRVDQAAELLGVSASTYYAAARRGEVPAIRIGRRLVVPGAALARLLEGSDEPDVAFLARPARRDLRAGDERAGRSAPADAYDALPGRGGRRGQKATEKAKAPTFRVEALTNP